MHFNPSRGCQRSNGAASGNCTGPTAPLLEGAKLAAGVSAIPSSVATCDALFGRRVPTAKNVHGEKRREILFYAEGL